MSVRALAHLPRIRRDKLQHASTQLFHNFRIQTLSTSCSSLQLPAAWKKGGARLTLKIAPRSSQVRQLSSTNIHDTTSRSSKPQRNHWRHARQHFSRRHHGFGFSIWCGSEERRPHHTRHTSHITISLLLFLHFSVLPQGTKQDGSKDTSSRSILLSFSFPYIQSHDCRTTKVLRTITVSRPVIVYVL